MLVTTEKVHKYIELITENYMAIKSLPEAMQVVEFHFHSVTENDKPSGKQLL